MAEGGNVTVFGEIADEFDALVTYNEKLLDNWVAGEGYSTSSMVLASTATAFMTFAKGFVDLGRIGNGVLVEGGIKGVGKDILRALNVAGGAGALIGRGAKLLRLVQGTNLCAWFSHVNAARLAGQRFFLMVPQLGRAANIHLGRVVAAGGTTVDQYFEMAMALKTLGVPVKLVSTGVSTIADVIKIARAYPRSVITFCLEGVKDGQTIGHTVYATWSRLGGLAIRDPLSRTAIFRSIAALAAEYGPGVKAMADFPVLRIPNSLLMTAANAAQTLAGGTTLGSLLLQLLPVIQVSAADDETAVQALMVHELAAAQRTAPKATPVVGVLSGKRHTVVAGDWLSKLAKRYYGNADKWPAIYAANARIVGEDPNLIRPGQSLLIPDLPGARIIAARAIPGAARAVA